MKAIYSILIFAFQSIEAISQSLYKGYEKRWSVAASTGFIFAHSKDVENTKGAHPWGIQADYAWRRIDSSTYKKFYSFPVQGLSLSYFNFDNAVLGHGVIAAYFLEPEIRFGKKAGMHFRTAAGITWLSNPYDEEKNPGNNSYSTPISGYIAVSIEPYVLLSPKWQLMLSGSYRHTSNGGLKLPNKGINWITGEVTLCYFPERKIDIKPILKEYSRQPYKRYLRWDAFAFGSIRGENDSVTVVRYGVAGAGMQVAKQTGRTHAFTIAAELSYDNADKQQMKMEDQSGNGIKVGAMVGHEFLWGKYIFSQQVGIYLFDPTPFYPAWYHRWGLYYVINDKFITGINLKAHKQVANYVDVRLIYSFRRKEL